MGRYFQTVFGSLVVLGEISISGTMIDEIINGSSQEKTSSKELNVYDIVLAGVIRE